MAHNCTIPCDAGHLRLALRRQLFWDALTERLPALMAVGLIVGGAALALVWAGPVTAVVLLGWALAAGAVLTGQAWLGTGMPATAAMHEEAVRQVERNAAALHPARAAELRARAAALEPHHAYFGTQTTRLLQDLREATGEAFRCPC